MCKLNVCVRLRVFLRMIARTGGWLWFQLNVHPSCTASHETTHKPTRMKETISKAASIPLKLVIQNIEFTPYARK